jgi:DNA-binding CsgD family transcriptional regulator
MNAAAEAEIKHHAGLVVGAGRLRARGRAADQRLQASIRWAAGLKGYAARQTARSVVPAQYGVLPVVLGESDMGVIDICWVRAEGGMILVSFNDRQAIEQRLEAAAVVYGLTPGQLRLVRLIVAGRDVVEAARDLDISVNTARTQLKRMFDKAGVSSQATLVRALLSVASPIG